MSSALLPRLAIRQSRWILQRRAQSSTAEAAKETASQKATEAKEGAQKVAGKAQEGLSRVTSSAGNVAGSAANAASSAAETAANRTGGMINYIQGLVPLATYYARVGGELAKIIVRGRNMQPPTLEAFQSYLQPVTRAVRNPSSALSGAAGAADNTAQALVNNPQSYLARLRNLDQETLITTGVVAAETLGFFCVGEMIGRFKIVGYRGGHSEHH